MDGNSIFHNGQVKIHHLNGMGRKGSTGWENLVFLHRYSLDNGVTWSAVRPVSSGANYQRRYQVISGVVQTRAGVLVQPCDATPGMEGPTAIHISRDGGKTWSDPGGDIRGIHAGVEELSDGRLIAFGRGQQIDGRMPMSISADMGETWEYSATGFPVIGGGQLLVLMRLREGRLLFVGFTNNGRSDLDTTMTFYGADGKAFEGVGMYSALSCDDGETWSNHKLLTSGKGIYQGYGWTVEFEATQSRAEHAGYLAATQTPDNVIHLISSGVHYRFNLKWLETAAAPVGVTD